MADDQAEPTTIHPRWQAWIAENLARGAQPEEIVTTLREAGVDRSQAEHHVHAIAQAPALAEARKLWWRVQALEQMVQLRREHRADQRPGHEHIARGPLPPVGEFLARHWVPGVPAIFTDLVPAWPALHRWSPRDFVERFGDVMIEACVGRRGIERPDAEWARIKRELSMRELMALIQDPDVGNDAYVIAKNAALTRPELAPLLDDLVLPRHYFGPHPLPHRMGLWLGPAGTHTPLHHDGENVMFCQVVGRKRFRLAPPESLPLLGDSRGVYARWDPKTEAELAEGPERLIELVLEPGEALFIPAGWWHQVDALDLGISVSILQFAWPNDYAWYRPGTLLRGRKPPGDQLA